MDLLTHYPFSFSQAHKRRVEPKTEDVYNDSFFDSRDCVLVSVEKFLSMNDQLFELEVRVTHVCIL